MADNTVVLLDVGGQLFTTTAATLTSPFAGGSMLRTMVNLHLEKQQLSSDAPADSMQPTLVDPRHPDALFIDRDGTNFSYILGYLRSGDEAVLPPDLHTTQLLLLEAQYYQLSGLIDRLERHERYLETVAHGAKQRPERIDSKLDKAIEHLDNIHDNIADLRKYLAPDKLFHTGKRGGPNYRKPRQLLEDVQGILEDLK